MYDRSAIMKAAWKTYHRERRYGRAFDRALLADCMKRAWDMAKWRAAEAEKSRAEAIEAFNAAPVAAKPMSEMEARIDALKYLSFRYDIGRMEAAIRAEYAGRASA